MGYDFRVIIQQKMQTSSGFLYEACSDQIDYKFWFDCKFGGDTILSIDYNPLLYSIDLNVDFNISDSYFSWFLVTELHVWMLMVRASAEGKEGKYIRDELVTRMWEDNTERMKLLAVWRRIAVNLIDTLIINWNHRFSFISFVCSFVLFGLVWQPIHSKERKMLLNQLNQMFLASVLAYDEVRLCFDFSCKKHQLTVHLYFVVLLRFAALIAIFRVQGFVQNDRVMAASVWRSFFAYDCKDYEKLEKIVNYIREQVCHSCFVLSFHSWCEYIDLIHSFLITFFFCFYIFFGHFSVNSFDHHQSWNVFVGRTNWVEKI